MTCRTPRQQGALGRLAVSPVLLFLVLLSSCGARRPTPALVPLGSCSALKDALRSAALVEMNRRIDAVIAELWQADGEPSEPLATKSYRDSGTNNQVPGVDEADFVKRHGDHLYVLAHRQLRIVALAPVEQARVVASVPIEGAPLSLLLADGRALVYADCSYDGGCTKLLLYDVTDPRQPTLLRELRVGARLLAARRYGTTTYAVFTPPAVRWKSVDYYVPRLPDEPSLFDRLTREAMYEELRVRRARAIRETSLDDATPRVEQTVPAVVEGYYTFSPIDSCSQSYRSSLGEGSQLTVVLGLDLHQQAPTRVATLVGASATVYASPQALYLAMARPSVDDEVRQTAVHKLTLEPAQAAVRYAASGWVDGYLAGVSLSQRQFAMDERAGLLRVASQQGSTPDDLQSRLTILAQDGDQLLSLGQVTGLGRGEKLRAVRFVDDRAYLVTFREVDPLLVLDLSDATTPRSLGELKVPGFATYLHPLGNDKLLTFGVEATDSGWLEGLRLQLVDVSQPTSPTLLHTEIIGLRSSRSAALTNHLAFTYVAPEQLLALPVTVCEDMAINGTYGPVATFSGLLAYDVSAATGFTERGRVQHGPLQHARCNADWTQSNSTVQRSLVFDATLLSLSRDRLVISRLADPSEQLAEVALVDAP